MQRLSGLLLMLAGVAMGLYAYLPEPRDGAADLAEITRISAAPDRPMRLSDGGVRTFSPTSPAFRERSPIEPVDTTAYAAEQKPGSWSTVVTVEDTGSTALRSSRPGDVETRAELTRDLQRELKRVGCYAGEITDAWTPAARNAMAAFMDRVNATLPVDEPDYILLALVQGHRDVACGAECPTGQVSAEGGRCVPRAVIAQASRKSKRLEEKRVAQARFENDQPLPSSEPEKLPWLQSKTEQPVVTAALPRSELPGRMSIGGPDMAAPPPSESAVAPGRANIPTASGPESDHLDEPADTPARQPDKKNAASKDGSDSSTIAALSPTDNQEVNDGTAAKPADPDALAPTDDETPAKKHKSKKSSRRDDDRALAYDDYGSVGRIRRGDPHPSLMRYNLMLSLGGVY